MPQEQSLEEMAADLATEETVAATPPSEETPPAAETKPTDPPATETDDSTVAAPEEEEGDREATSEDDADFISYVRNKHGEDLSQKYENSEEAVKGLVESYRLAGRRNEDATYGRTLRELIQGREEDLAAYLKGQKPQQTEAAGDKPISSERELEDFPADADNWRLQLTEKDGIVTPAAGAGFSMADYNAYNAAWTRRMLQVARGWKDVQNIPETVRKEVGQLQTSAAEQRENQAVRETLTRYGKAIFIDGPGSQLTAEGQKIDTECLRIRERFNASASVALDEAIRNVLGNNQRPTKPPPVKPGKPAVRQPGIAAGTKTYKSVEDELEQRIDADPDKMAEILAEIHQREGAGSLG